MTYISVEGMGIKDQCKIRIDYGLFEWLIWYPNDLPEWCTTAELITAGYNIDCNYQSSMTIEQLIESRDEDCSEFYLRNHYAVERAIEKESEFFCCA